MIYPPVANTLPEPSVIFELFIAVRPAVSPMSITPLMGTSLILPSMSMSKVLRSAPTSFTVITPYAEENTLSLRLKRSSGISGISSCVSAYAGEAVSVSDDDCAEGETSGSLRFWIVAISESMSMLIPPKEISASLILPLKSAGKFTRPDK